MVDKAVLFLYEGESEGEFYPQIFRTKLTPRGVKFSKCCLKGNFNINAKVANAIDNFLARNENVDLHVFVALDRDKPKPTPPPINVLGIIKQVGSDRLIDVELIIATRDFESWLFIDIENVYKYLRVPKSKRVPQKFQNWENLCHLDMARLFKQFGQEYRKGRRVNGLIAELNLENIYNSCTELRDGITAMSLLCNINN